VFTQEIVRRRKAAEFEVATDIIIIRKFFFYPIPKGVTLCSRGLLLISRYVSTDRHILYYSGANLGYARAC
jgi:hypothetical protein